MKYKHGFFFYLSLVLFCIAFAPVVFALAAGRLVYSLLLGQAVTSVVSASRPENRDELDAETDYIHDARKKALLSAVLSGVLLFALLSVPAFGLIHSHAETKRAAQLASLSASVSESAPEPSSLTAPESVPAASSELSEEVTASSSVSSETSTDESSADASEESDAESVSAEESSAEVPAESEESSEPAEDVPAESSEPSEPAPAAVPESSEESAAEESSEVYEGLTIETFFCPGANSDAYVRVHGKPNTSYSITVMFPSGASRAKGVTGGNRTKTSDEYGYVSWDWRMGPSVKDGSRVTVTVSGGGESTSRTETV